MKKDQILYGELVVLGTNGRLATGDKGRRRSRMRLYKRAEANGVKPGRIERVPDASRSTAVQSRDRHAVSYTLSRYEAIVVEYEKDPKIDMFQIGRSTDEHIDFVVSEMEPPATSAVGATQSASAPDMVAAAASSESTVSRFACRIYVDRDPPHASRIYAAGFDASRNIFLGERAIKWRSKGSEMDGLTTNGVMILRPNASLWSPNDHGGVEPGMATNSPRGQGGDDVAVQDTEGKHASAPDANSYAEEDAGDVHNETAMDPRVTGVFSPRGDHGVHRDVAWQEISVCGRVYQMRQKRSVPDESNRVDEDNVLVDGTLIDLCGVTLLWRSKHGLDATATIKDLGVMVDRLNLARIQCPVRYQTLLIPRPQVASLADPSSSGPAAAGVSAAPTGQGLGPLLPTSANALDWSSGDRQPFVYLRCGHVHGFHTWRDQGDANRGGLRTCPLCRQASQFVALVLGQEPAFYVDKKAATYCFHPCGHFASEATVRYWCSVLLPNRHNFDLCPRCPFCLTAINGPPVRLIFQGDIDESAMLADNLASAQLLQPEQKPGGDTGTGGSDARK